MWKIIVVSLAGLMVGCGGDSFGEGQAPGVPSDASTDKVVADAAGSDAHDGTTADSNPDSDAPEGETVPEAGSDAGLETTSDVAVETGADAAEEPEACEPTSCSKAGANCGSLDNGCGKTLDCGACPQDQFCGAVEDNKCCIADTCASMGYVCGKMNDNCGHTVHCGPAFAWESQFDYICTGNGLKPHAWSCLNGGAPVKKLGEPPFAGCQLAPAIPVWCCDEAPDAG